MKEVLGVFWNISNVKKTKHMSWRDELAPLISETDTQLQRLGWSVDQGKKHLISTYGKRSRWLLSKEELQDFLNFLLAQNT